MSDAVRRIRAGLFLVVLLPAASGAKTIESLYAWHAGEVCSQDFQAPVFKSGQVVDPLFNTSPDWSATPGKLCTTSDKDFSEYRYPERIPYCKRNVPKSVKLQVAARYGVPEDQFSKYQFDHLINLSIGGSNSPDNLWPEPLGSDEANGKDKLEYEVYQQLAAGTITQAEAVRRIYAWFDSKGIRLF
ncbi:MAG: hypothetical protein WC728_08200 [Elusimicrobiota bacterium]